MSTLVFPCPTLPCLLWCPGSSSAPWGWMGVVLGAGLDLAVLSSPKGLKVVKRGRSSSMGSPVPGSGEKKAQGREVSTACRALQSLGGSKTPPAGPALTNNLGKHHLHLVFPKLRFITLIPPPQGDHAAPA